MCGIAAILVPGSTSQSHPDALPVVDLAGLSRRGPDALGRVQCDADCALVATVLRMHGHCPQPLVCEAYDMVFNGEIYGACVPAGQSDTQFFASRLFAKTNLAAELGPVLDALELEASLCVYCKADKCLLFARDVLGRRSLLMQLDPAGRYLLVASVALNAGEWTEVGVDAVFRARIVDSKVQIDAIPRPTTAKLFALSGFAQCSSLEEALSAAVSDRLNLETLCDCGDAIGILFSGGLDCVALAALSHRVFLGTIYLMNASFGVTSEATQSSPDRISATDAFDELAAVFGENHRFVLRKVDVTLDDLVSSQNSILDLIRPKNTIMDFNLASVLFFAARGAPANVRCLLSGIGADELLGGYARHATAFKRGGRDALRAELTMDLNRLWTRNLGRDDRAVSVSGKELRAPYLDARVLQFIGNAAPPTEPGNKVLLRRMVHSMGMVKASAREKKAMQFGSGIAKLTGGNGTDVFCGILPS